MNMYRQGDVLIVEIEEIPEETKKAIPKNGKWILAEGEATGHAHAILVMAGIMLFEQTKKQTTNDKTLPPMFLKSNIECEVTHQEHETIKLPAGTFEIIRQRYYAPREIRNVAD